MDECGHDSMDGLGHDLWWCFECKRVVVVEDVPNSSLLVTTRLATYDEVRAAVGAEGTP